MRLGDVIDALRVSLPPVDQPWEASVHPDWLVHRLAAVLIVLYPSNGEASFLLTKRPDTLKSHPGQIALPGGRVEPDDVSPWTASLRETWEEIGIEPNVVVPVGRLNPLQVTVSNHLVLPFVGCLPELPSARPMSAEVEDVFEVRVSDLLDPDNVGEQAWPLRDGKSYLVTYYRVAGRTVWGVTARVLSDFTSRVSDVDWTYPPGSVRWAG
jgi:8-oxo-dGTP pyrophosphatase MutT (NUDIX family)